MSKRAIIHIDMDAFFAAIEELKHPEYRGKPIVVGGDGDPRKRGVVSTASYEARKYGIRSAMPLRVALRKCPQAIFLPVDISAYSRISERLMGILKEYSPLLEPAGLDEAYLDVTDNPQGSPEEIARQIKERIRRDLGLTASIGIGPNKLLAKIASDLNKPDGFTVIREEEVEQILNPLPIRRLWGVGPKTEMRLKDMGINTIGDLARTPLEVLTTDFGRAFGEMLHNFSRGIDNSPLLTTWEPKSMSRETTYQVDTSDLRTIKNTLWELVKELATDLKKEGYWGKTVTLKLRYQGFITVTRAQTISQFVDSPEEIFKIALGLLPKFDLKKKVRLVGVRLSNLQKRPG